MEELEDLATITHFLSLSSSLTSLSLLPERSLQASRFVVLSIWAPSARSIAPKPPFPPTRVSTASTFADSGKEEGLSNLRPLWYSMNGPS